VSSTRIVRLLWRFRCWPNRGRRTTCPVLICRRCD